MKSSEINYTIYLMPTLDFIYVHKSHIISI